MSLASRRAKGNDDDDDDDDVPRCKDNCAIIAKLDTPFWCPFLQFPSIQTDPSTQTEFEGLNKNSSQLRVWLQTQLAFGWEKTGGINDI